MFRLKKKLIVLFLLTTAGCFFSSPPPDAEMEEKFRNNAAAFNRLVVMMREDFNLASVDAKTAYLPAAEIGGELLGANIPEKRLDEYRRLLKQTGVSEIRNIGGEVAFLVWESRTLDPMNSGHKNYLYTESLPAPLLDSLEDTRKLQSQSGEDWGYKKIGENWYLEFRYLH